MLTAFLENVSQSLKDQNSRLLLFYVFHQNPSTIFFLKAFAESFLDFLFVFRFANWIKVVSFEYFRIDVISTEIVFFLLQLRG